MSDIYLQITETPTVVTLSAPVISGALSSTVTVANTVTVALDANSLSALENVTVTVGAAVTISNFPATQMIAGTVTVGSLPAISGTVTANLSSSNLNTVTIGVRGSVTVGNTTQITDSVVGGFNNIFGNNGTFKVDIRTQDGSVLDGEASVPVQGTVDIGSLPAISGTVTIGAGASQIGSVTASISGTVPISISSVTVGNSVTIGSLPAISGTVTANIGNSSAVSAGFVKICGEVAGGAPSDPKEIITDSQGMLYARIAPSNSLTSDPVKYDPVLGDAYINVRQYTGTSVTIGSLPAISGTVTANTFALQGTAVTTSNFTSTTASTVLANYNATRQVLTIFNEGAGNLHICAGATCTTIAYQVRLSAGDYYEVPNHQTTITHSAVFATAGTARVTEVS